MTVFVIAFVPGQILGNVIVPRGMGSMVGLNPLWLPFTLLLGALRWRDYQASFLPSLWLAR